jgi:hypothetical protein
LLLKVNYRFGADKSAGTRDNNRLHLILHSELFMSHNTWQG